MKKLSPITWVSKEVNTSAIQPTPNNYKIKTALGLARFQASVGSFGRAGTVICNWAAKLGDLTKLILIDGNTRWQDAIENKEKKIWVSLPSRILTPAEFKEFSAMIDFAKAGDVDMNRIEQELGTTSKFFEKYGLEVPMEKMSTLGANAGKGPKKNEPEEIKPPVEVDEYPVTLFFNKKQEAEFRKIEEKLKVRYKTISTSDTVLKALRKL